MRRSLDTRYINRSVTDIQLIATDFPLFIFIKISKNGGEIIFHG